MEVEGLVALLSGGGIGEVVDALGTILLVLGVTVVPAVLCIVYLTRKW